MKIINIKYSVNHYGVFFLKNNVYHVFKYPEYDKLTHRLCIQDIKWNILHLFFFLWAQCLSCPNVKEAEGKCVAKENKVLNYLKLEVLTLFFWNLHRSLSSQS